MDNVPVSQLIFTALSLVFLLLGLTLIITVIMFANPYDTIAFANVEKLRAAMDQACLNPGAEVDISFTLQQTNPSRLSLAFSFLPIWITNIYGDPKYAVYYEAFPPGEGTGWEIYHFMQNRLLAPLPGGFDRQGSAQIQDHTRKVLEHWTRASNQLPSSNRAEGVIVNNIILGGEKPTNHLNPPAGTPQSSSDDRQTQTYGRWKNAEDAEGIVPAEGDNQFLFNNYRALNSFDKTAIKYMPCGENALCFKTPTGVYKYPLRHCNNIKAVQLVFDATADSEATLEKLKLTSVELGAARAGVTWLGRLTVVKLMVKHPIIAILGIGEIIRGVKDVIAHYVNVRTGDFAIVSPCELKDVKIRVGDCNNLETDRAGYFDADFNPCTRVIDYPIYQYTSGGALAKVGEHSACVEKIGDSIYDTNNIGTYGSGDQCIQVTAGVGDGYCWTKEPYKDYGLKGVFLSRTDFIGAIADLTGRTPIRDNTALLDDSQTGEEVVALFPTQVALKKGEKLLDALDRKWWWGWPG